MGNLSLGFTAARGTKKSGSWVGASVCRMHRSASDVTKKHPRKTGETPGQQPGATGHQDRPTRATNRHSNETQTRQG